MELNAAQMAAVTSTSRRLLILAGPGTGKTETLTERIAHFIENKELPACQVLMFTYTNKAANNMSQRIRGKLSLQTDIRSGTFNSLCYRLTQQELCTKGILPAYKVLPEHHATRLRKEACSQYTNAHPEVAALLRAHRLQRTVQLAMLREGEDVTGPDALQEARQALGTRCEVPRRRRRDHPQL